MALSLMAKPMLVTLPLLLLLIDYVLGAYAATWTTARRLVLEKVPLFALSVASAYLTMIAQTGSMEDSQNFPLPFQVGRVIYAYGLYLWKLVAPLDLIPLYEAPDLATFPLWQTLVSALTMAALTFAVVKARRRTRLPLAGWAWFLVSALPIIGVVKVGLQIIADRYTYVPHLGLYLLVAEVVVPLLATRPAVRRVWIAGGAIVTALLAVLTWRQVPIWRDARALWQYTLTVQPDHYIALANLGVSDLNSLDYEAASKLFRKATDRFPTSPFAHERLGYALAKAGNRAAGRAELERALDLRPRLASAMARLA
jgi:tetratricopeptide (TPR) repeat protein